MHSVFLYHAIKKGMRMGIVNPSLLEIYDDIPKKLLEYVEDVILNRREDATERLLDYAENISNSSKKEQISIGQGWGLTWAEPLSRAAPAPALAN